VAKSLNLPGHDDRGLTDLWILIERQGPLTNAVHTRQSHSRIGMTANEF
jgi:hypothetical protein